MCLRRQALTRSGEPNELCELPELLSLSRVHTICDSLLRTHVAHALPFSRLPNVYIKSGFPFLEKLQLKKIIFLAPDDPSPQLCALLTRVPCFSLFQAVTFSCSYACS